MATIDRRGVVVDATDTIIAGDPNPGLAIKAPVLVATTGNIVLAGLQTIDGVALPAGARVLVWQQSDPTTNGIYNASTGNWTRTIDAVGNDLFASGLQVLAASGTLLGGATFFITSPDPIQLGTSPITFSLLTARASRVINTTYPLLGGGDLSADRTISIATNGIGYGLLPQVTARRLIGNPTGALANISEIGLGATLAFSGSSLQTLALTGEVTSSANSFVTTILRSLAPTWTGLHTFGAGLAFSGSVAVAGPSIFQNANILTFAGGSNGFAFDNQAIGLTLLGLSNTGALRLNTYGAGMLLSDASGNITSSGTLSSSFFANPANAIGLTVINGTATTAMRSDAAPALSQSIVPTWTGLHAFQAGLTLTNPTSTVRALILLPGAGIISSPTTYAASDGLALRYFNAGSGARFADIVADSSASSLSSSIRFFTNNGASATREAGRFDSAGNLNLNFGLNNVATNGGLSLTGTASSLLFGNIFGGPTLEHFGSLWNLTAGYAANPEIGLAVTMTSNAGAGNVTYYKVAAGFNMQINPGSAPGWAQTSVASLAPGVGPIQATVAEFDLNVGNMNYTLAMAAVGNTAANIVIAGTNAGGYGSAGIVIAFGGSTTAPMWDVGISFGITGFRTFNTATIMDTSSAPTSILIAGSHTKGIDFSTSSCTFGVLFPNNQSALNQLNTGGSVANLTFLDTSNIQQFGSAGLTAGHHFNGNSSGTFFNIVNSHSSAGDYGIQLQLGAPTATDASSLYMNFVNPANSIQRGSISANDSAGVGHVAFNTSSDQRLKRDLGLVEDSLSRLMQIKIHKYVGLDYSGEDWDEGFFAQELHSIYRFAVTPNDDADYKMKPWQVDYGRTAPLSIGAIQDLNRKVDTIDERVRRLELH